MGLNVLDCAELLQYSILSWDMNGYIFFSYFKLYRSNLQVDFYENENWLLSIVQYTTYTVFEMHNAMD